MFIMLMFALTVTDAHTVADVDYKWKGGDNKGVEIVSSKMAQFDLLRFKTFNDASTNSKGRYYRTRGGLCQKYFLSHLYFYFIYA